MPKSLSLTDLKRGDVLLFEGMDSDMISSTIMYLTNSRVSHAAMVYDEETGGKPATLVHEASPKVPVSVRNAAASFGDRLITIRRLPEPPACDKGKLIAAADRYLHENAPYNNNGLYLVGVLLIYRKFVPDGKTSRIIAGILKLATKLVTHLLNKKKFASQHPMTCSQFVAQCYDDAGDNYRLFDSGLFSLDSNAYEDKLDSGETLLEQVMIALENDRVSMPVTNNALFDEFERDMTEQEIIAEAERLSGQLLDALKMAESANIDNAESSVVDSELSIAIGEFADAFYQLNNDETELENDYANGVSNKLFNKMKWLQEQRNLHVSPADLLRSNKLDTVGEIRMK